MRKNLKKVCLGDALAPYVEPYTVTETGEATAARDRVVAACEDLYANAQTTAEKALWSRGAEKTSRLALLYAISENPADPLITDTAVDWAWAVVSHLTRRLIYQASVYVHDNEFDALRQKAIRYLRDYGNGSLSHGQLLRYLHIDSDTFRRVIDTLLQSELVTATPLTRGGFRYTLAAKKETRKWLRKKSRSHPSRSRSSSGSRRPSRPRNGKAPWPSGESPLASGRKPPGQNGRPPWGFSVPLWGTETNLSGPCGGGRRRPENQNRRKESTK